MAEDPVTMATLTIINRADTGNGLPSEPPTKRDGSLYRYEMLHSGTTRRSYADTPAALLDVLAPGYADADADKQWRTRLTLAATAQVTVQASLNLNPVLASLPQAQQRILQAPRHNPPVIATWDCPIPLVLIATDYFPAGKLPAPSVSDGMAPNVLWLDPSDDVTLLNSLNDLNVIVLNETGE